MMDAAIRERRQAGVQGTRDSVDSPDEEHWEAPSHHSLARTDRRGRVTHDRVAMSGGETPGAGGGRGGRRSLKTTAVAGAAESVMKKLTSLESLLLRMLGRMWTYAG